jgi:hypothetical protein
LRGAVSRLQAWLGERLAARGDGDDDARQLVVFDPAAEPRVFVLTVLDIRARRLQFPRRQRAAKMPPAAEGLSFRFRLSVAHLLAG